MFDITDWLAGLSHSSPDDVHYVDEHERRGGLIVNYDCAGKHAQVQLAQVGGVSAAAWELRAEVDGLSGRVVVPGGTHFIWHHRDRDARLRGGKR